MARCPYCDKSRWFQRLSEHGLCNACSEVYVYHASEVYGIVAKSADMIMTAKTLKTQLSRCDLIISKASELISYEKAGTKTFEYKPSAMIQDAMVQANACVIYEATSIMDKAKLLDADSRKITAATKARVLINEHKDRMTKGDFHAWEETVNLFILEVKLNKFTMAAEKCELKEQWKKALDQYYEALFLVQNDHIPDNEQQDLIHRLEGKIAEMKSRS